MCYEFYQLTAAVSTASSIRVLPFIPSLICSEVSLQPWNSNRQIHPLKLYKVWNGSTSGNLEAI